MRSTIIHWQRNDASVVPASITGGTCAYQFPGEWEPAEWFDVAGDGILAVVIATDEGNSGIAVSNESD